MTDADTILNILTLTRIILSHPDHWTKWCCWRDRQGVAINANIDIVACLPPPMSFCLSGALQYAASQMGLTPSQFMIVARQIAPLLTQDLVEAQYRDPSERYYNPFVDLIRWNDELSTTHADILAGLDQALINLTIREGETATQDTDHVFV